MKKSNVCEKDSELNNELLGIYFDEYYNLLDARRRKMAPKYDPASLTFISYDHQHWYKKESDDTTVKDDEKELYVLPPLKGDEEEVKKEKRLKVLTPKKLLTGLPVSFEQIKAGNNSFKLKSEIRQILYLFCQQNKIMKTIYSNLIKSP